MTWPKNGRPEPRMTEREIGHMSDPDCGFYIHMVPLGGEAQPYLNAHTHGVPETCDGQLDFQTVVNLLPRTISEVMWELVDRVKKGERFNDGDAAMIFGTLRVTFKRFPEGHADRGDVLRVILPCSSNKLPGEEGHDPQFFPLQATLDTGNLPWGEAPGCHDVPQCSRKGKPR